MSKLLALNPVLILGIAMLVFLAAASSLRAYAGGAALWVLLLALALYCIGNLMMVPLMKANGMAVAMSVSAVLQLVMSSLVAVAWFGERPLSVQWAGIALGLVAVTLILWPQMVKSA
jgi:drug/metabolite transporter (DMT)-like permease